MTVLAAATSGVGLLDPSRPLVRLDQDLIFGRAVRDSVRVYAGVPFKRDAHLERLSHSAAALGLPAVNMPELLGLMDRVASECSDGDHVLRMYWTSGRDPGEPGLANDGETGWAMVLAVPIPAHLDELRARGLRLVSLESGTDGAVRGRSPWLLPGAKPTGSAANSAAWREVQHRGADDAVMIDVAGRVLEGPGTNVWWRRGRSLHTASLDLGVMPGITRAAVVELAPALDYEVREGQWPLEELAGADEAFVTSTVAEVVGVVELDGEAIGDGRIGEASRLLLRELRKLASPGR